MKYSACLWYVLISMWLMTPVQAAGENRGLRVENPDFRLGLIPRSPEQMAAFYEARGLSKAAVKRIRQACFITAWIRNKDRGVVWLELANWRFMSSAGEIKRLPRAHWQEQWRQVDLPMAGRSTFGWTLLPEVRDLQPSEPVGGNVVLAPTTEPMTLEAVFKTAADKSGQAIRVRVENVRCLADGNAR